VTPDGAARHLFVRTRLRADLGPPLLRIDALRRADLTTAQQLRIITAGSLEVVLDDPPKPLVMLRLHATTRWSLTPGTRSLATRRAGASAVRQHLYAAL